MEFKYNIYEYNIIYDHITPYPNNVIATNKLHRDQRHW